MARVQYLIILVFQTGGVVVYVSFVRPVRSQHNRKGAITTVNDSLHIIVSFMYDIWFTTECALQRKVSRVSCVRQIRMIRNEMFLKTE